MSEQQPLRFASDAFAQFGAVPSPKAWELAQGGSLSILGCIEITKGKLGEIKADQEGHSSSLPLMIRATTVRDIWAEANATITDGFEPAPHLYRDITDAYRATGAIDKRLSPKSREALVHVMGNDAQGSCRYARNEIARCERNSFFGQIQARALGYARGGAVGIAKLINAYLWSEIFDRRIASTAILAFSHRATTDHYNRIAAEWTANEASGHRFGLADMIDTHRPAFAFLDALQANHVAIRRQAKGKNAGEGHEPNFFAFEAAPLVEVVSQVRETFRLIGLRPAVWRMMLKMSTPQLVALQPLMSRALSGGLTIQTFDPAGGLAEKHDERATAIAMLNRMAELGAQNAPRTFLFQIGLLRDEACKAILPLLRGILDEGLRSSKRGQVRRQAALIGMIADAWISLLRNDDPITRTPNLAWPAMVRAQNNWHAEFNDFHHVVDESLTWCPLLPSYETPVAKATELCSWQALRDEGADQDHCVASYATACASPDSDTRIFALKLIGRSAARSTVEVRRSPSRVWRVVQHRGFKNNPAHPKLATWTRNLIAALNRAQVDADAAPPSILRLAA